MSTELIEDVIGWTLGEEAIESHDYKEWFRTLAAVNSFDECVSVGVDLAVTASDANFKIGDLANMVVRVERGIDGEAVSKKTTLNEFSKGIRIDYSRVKEAARVARAVEWGIRTSFRGCTYSHFRAMVRYGIIGTDLVKWAKEVEDNNLSVKALEGALTEVVTGEERDGGKRADDWLAKAGDQARRLSEEDIQQCYIARAGVISDDILSIRGVLDSFEAIARDDTGAVEDSDVSEALGMKVERRPSRNIAEALSAPDTWGDSSES